MIACLNIHFDEIIIFQCIYSCKNKAKYSHIMNNLATISMTLPLWLTRAAERIFIWGGKGKKGHNNVKKGTNGAHADNIANVLMKHHCRQRFFLHAERFFFFFCWEELNKTSPPTPKINK